MRFFVSYSRRDNSKIEPLVKRLGQLGHETWRDDRLAGGQAWWDEILANIRNSDAFLFAISEASLESEACRLERGYATSLGKPMLPVAVAVVPPQLLPPDLAAIQFVDYSTPGEDAAIQLAGALGRMTAAPALPDPLPPPPEIPVSYLSDLSQKIFATSLSLEEQRSVVASLEEAVRRSKMQQDPDDHQAALELLDKLEQRSDLYAETARRITEAKAATGSAPPFVRSPGPEPSRPSAPAPSVTPVGGSAWVAQPTGVPRRTPRWIIGLVVVVAIVLMLFLAAAFQAGQDLGATPTPTCLFDDFGNPIFCP